MKICVRFETVAARHLMQNRESHGLCLRVDT